MIIIRAKYLIPNPEDYIENGAVAIKGTRIHRVGRFAEVKILPDIGKIIDLGNAVILPGLINTHTHLDLTNLHRRIKPTNNFTHWIFQLLAARTRWKDEKYISSIEKGIKLSVEAGTTTIADIANTSHSFSALKKSPLRKIVYKEIIDLDPSHAKDVMEKIQWELSTITTDDLFRIGLSPHAPYSVSRELYRAVSQLARETNMPVCTHIAETEDEIEFLEKGTGNFPILLRQIRAMNNNWQPPGLSPIKYLNETGLLGNHPLLIHCNYITDDEITLIKSSGASVAFCPRSHHFFSHTNHPVQRLLDAGISVGLGTDSLASNDTLSILDEMKFLFHHYPILPKALLFMATLNGAKSLGLELQVGRIKEGFEADLCGIRLPDCHTENIYNQ
ncbi:MAG TPA: amidohydrolase family protein, partial [Candidatus Brocadiaceae bacterium]